MEELDAEGLAPHSGPESCVGVREGVGEALAGVRVGRVIEPRNPGSSGCRRCCMSGRQYRWWRYARAVRGPRAVGEPRHARNLRAREPGGPMSARPADHWAGRSGNVEAVRLG